MESRKNDIKDDKLRWDLLPLCIPRSWVEVAHFGAKKYAPNSWQNLENAYDRYKAAMFRHLDAFESGEEYDKESGLHHLKHMVWNACAMLFVVVFRKKEQ